MTGHAAILLIVAMSAALSLSVVVILKGFTKAHGRDYDRFAGRQPVLPGSLPRLDYGAPEHAGRRPAAAICLLADMAEMVEGADVHRWRVACASD